jgi:hypothetical protein
MHPYFAASRVCSFALSLNKETRAEFSQLCHYLPLAMLLALVSRAGAEVGISLAKILLPSSKKGRCIFNGKMPHHHQHTTTIISIFIFRAPPRAKADRKMKTLLLTHLFLFTHAQVLAAAFSSSPSELTLPRSREDIVRQAAKYISAAYQNGQNLQSIRLPLSESMYANAEEGFVADRAIGWQGGPQETLRYLSPMVSNLLKQVKMTGS